MHISQIWCVDASCGCRVSHTIFGVSATLASDLVSRISLSGAYLKYEFQFWCVDSFLGSRVSHTLLGHSDLDLTSFLE